MSSCRIFCAWRPCCLRLRGLRLHWCSLGPHPLLMTRLQGEFDCSTPPLQITIASRGVQVQHAVLDVVVQLEIERALVDGSHDRLGTVGNKRQEVTDRVEHSVNALP